jgi:hypothetical protein
MICAVSGASAPIDSAAAAEAERLSVRFEADPSRLSSQSLWYLGIWDVHLGRLDQARAVRDSLRSRAARSENRVDRLLEKSISARLALAGRDSVSARSLLAELVPDGERQLLQWNPWESLGGERLLLAELELARGRFAAASRIAANFDAPAPIPYVMHLRRALEIRRTAAEEVSDRRTATLMQHRLDELGKARVIRRSP